MSESRPISMTNNTCPLTGGEAAMNDPPGTTQNHDMPSAESPVSAYPYSFQQYNDPFAAGSYLGYEGLHAAPGAQQTPNGASPHSSIYPPFAPPGFHHLPSLGPFQPTNHPYPYMPDPQPFASFHGFARAAPQHGECVPSGHRNGAAVSSGHRSTYLDAPGMNPVAPSTNRPSTAAPPTFGWRRGVLPDPPPGMTSNVASRPSMGDRYRPTDSYRPQQDDPYSMYLPSRRPEHRVNRRTQDSRLQDVVRRSGPMTAPGASNNGRGERSTSPQLSSFRASHRRSYDRFVDDLDSLGSSQADDEAQLASARRRRRVPMRPGYFDYDRNKVTANQMKDLKNKLRHLLPSQLPENESKTCEICQKDFATNNVPNPTEEEEMAVELPCKHIFGECCINTWFETCTKHKNKITCPMCRKVLIEPLDLEGQFMSIFPGGQMEELIMATGISLEDRQALLDRMIVFRNATALSGRPRRSD